MDKAIIMAVAEAHARRDLLDALEHEIVAMPHYECDDCWYSCHLHPDCCQEYTGEPKCTCWKEPLLAVIRKHREDTHG